MSKQSWVDVPIKRLMTIILKPLVFSQYTNKEVQCGGKKGDSLMIKQTVCGKFLVISEIKAYYYSFMIGKW